MAHFAQLNENGQVVQVIVVNNSDCGDLPFPESEIIGIEFCRSLFGSDTIWLQTSYNANFRYNYAGIGFTYDPTLNAFIAPKPYASWVLDTASCKWQPPKPYPSDGNLYHWDETTQSWVA